MDLDRILAVMAASIYAGKIQDKRSGYRTDQLAKQSVEEARMIWETVLAQRGAGEPDFN